MELQLGTVLLLLISSMAVQDESRMAACCS
jgi:hypothetical protein